MKVNLHKDLGFSFLLADSARQKKDSIFTLSLPEKPERF